MRSFGLHYCSDVEVVLLDRSWGRSSAGDAKQKKPQAATFTMTWQHPVGFDRGVGCVVVGGENSGDAMPTQPRTVYASADEKNTDGCLYITLLRCAWGNRQAKPCCGGSERTGCKVALVSKPIMGDSGKGGPCPVKHGTDTRWLHCFQS